MLLTLLALTWLASPAQAPPPAADAPRVAGVDVPAPRRTRVTLPEYPPEAQTRGVRGIVILELLIDAQGKVASAQVVRSIPGLDEAALAAVRNWEYEPTRVDGQPVSVRLTVPITFASRLPEVSRAEGVPELRQGAVPSYPKGTFGADAVGVVVELTLEADGRVAEAALRSGPDPFAQALLQAVRGWRFAPSDEGATLSVRLEASFLPATGGQPARVDLRLTGVRHSETLAGAPAPVPSPSTPVPPVAPESPGQGAPRPRSSPRPASSRRAAPTEALTAGVPSGSPSEAGASVADVRLDPGLPDLVRGRRPVVPPLARMTGATGTVEVRFSVDAAGRTLVQSVEGPDPLKTVAQEAVTTWVFRRVSTEQLRLLAVFNYGPANASATVKPAPEPTPQPTPTPSESPG